MDLLQSVDPTSSSLSSADPYRPSFFELAAQEQLRDLLQPAVRYILSVLAQRSPRYLLRIVNRFDELWAIIMWTVERHYLRTWGSSFAENFYGLRRRRRPGVSTDRARAGSTRAGLAAHEALRPREIYASLFFLVGLPYLQTKAKDYWESVGGGVDGGADALFDDEEEQGERRTRTFRETSQSRIQNARDTAKELFKKGYPYAGVAGQLWLLSYNVAYLFDKTPYWRPWLQLLKVDIRRAGAEDYPPSPPLLPPNMPSPLRSPVQFILSLLRSSPFIFFETLKYALPASIFFFKFLEWWYSADNPRRRRGGAAGGAGTSGIWGAPIFGAPKVLLPHPDGCVYKKDSKWKDPVVPSTLADSVPRPDEKAQPGSLLHNGCPLCGAAPINNPCALPTGYVLCYTCAHAYVEEHSRCPVTLRPIKGGTSELRKVLG